MFGLVVLGIFAILFAINFVVAIGYYIYWFFKALVIYIQEEKKASKKQIWK